MALSDRGRAALANLHRDWRLGRIPKQVLRKFMSAVFRVWNTRKRSYEAIAEVSNRDPVAYLFRGPAADKACGSCSRVMTAHMFLKHNIRRRRGGTIITDHDCMKTIARYERRGLAPRSVKGEMRGPRPFAWVTKTSSLDELRRQNRDAGTTVRDRLGLIHYFGDDRLIEVIYPAAVFERLQLVGPTFIEGSAGIVFRSVTHADGWGRAVDLQTLGEGLPEAVHPPEPLTAEFRVRMIGPIRGVSHNFSWDQISDEQWNADEIRQFEAELHGK